MAGTMWRAGRPLMGVMVLAGSLTAIDGLPAAEAAARDPGPGRQVAVTQGLVVRMPADTAASDRAQEQARGQAREPVAMPAACPTIRFAVPLANEILAGRLKLGPHPAIHLAADPTWSEWPVHDVNWPVRYQGLSWIGPLVTAWRETHELRYARRARFLVDDWLADNPPGRARSPYGWYNQSTGVRASMLACVAAVFGTWPRLRAGLLTHGRILADPGFYVWSGNHALDQDIGLLDAGHAAGRRDWMDLARSRVADLVVRSVSVDGVTNEQAVGYQAYNFRHYTHAADRMSAYGLPLPSGLSRVARMPRLLAFAILPNGEYDEIGDTTASPVYRLDGTVAERSQTAGASGRVPDSTVAVFGREGWLFARTGWGTERPFRDETALGLHFGPPPIFHGHADGGSLTLYSHGSRLVLDPGKYRYTPSPLRTWFKSRAAHNVVLVDGVRLERVTTHLVRQATTPRLVRATLRTATAGTSVERTVLFSRKLGYVVVEDRVRSSSGRTVRQRWHLPEDARPRIAGATVETRRTRGNLQLIELAGGRIGLEPGWVSYRYGAKVGAPIVEAVQHGSVVRFVTLLVPGAATPEARVTGLRLTDGGFTFDITVDGVTEHVVLDGASASIADR